MAPSAPILGYGCCFWVKSGLEVAALAGSPLHSSVHTCQLYIGPMGAAVKEMYKVDVSRLCNGVCARWRGGGFWCRQAHGEGPNVFHEGQPAPAGFGQLHGMRALYLICTDSANLHPQTEEFW